jgi:hypothetical protein
MTVDRPNGFILSSAYNVGEPPMFRIDCKMTEPGRLCQQNLLLFVTLEAIGFCAFGHFFYRRPGGGMKCTEMSYLKQRLPQTSNWPNVSYSRPFTVDHTQMSQWAPAVDETLGIRRTRDSGTVFQNAEIASGLVSAAYSNKKPLYKMPVGTSDDSVGKVRNGDVLFTVSGIGARINKLGGSGVHNSNKVLAISLLNGQGTAEKPESDANHDALMHDIQFQGIAEQGNGNQAKHLAGTLFNCMMGGITQLKNICNEDIERGDWLEIWAPLVRQIASGSGKHKSPEDLLGEVRVWLRPFHPQRFKTIPKSVYNCLTDSAEYRTEFENVCNAYLDSVVEMAAICVAVDSDDDAMGSEFYERMRSDGGGNAQKRADLIDALFMSYSENGLPRTVNGAEDLSLQTMDRLRYTAAGKYFASAGHLLHTITKNVVMRATTGGQPGHFFNSQFGHYGSV